MRGKRRDRQWWNSVKFYWTTDRSRWSHQGGRIPGHLVTSSLFAKSSSNAKPFLGNAFILFYFILGDAFKRSTRALLWWRTKAMPVSDLKVKALVAQYYLCLSIGCSPTGSSIGGTLQARILEWVAVPFSRGYSWPGDQTWVSWREADCFPCGSAGKESACNAGDVGSIPGLVRSPGEGKGYLLLYSGLENSMDCIAHGVTKSQTRLSDFHYLPSEPPGKPQRTTNRELGSFSLIMSLDIHLYFLPVLLVTLTKSLN